MVLVALRAAVVLAEELGVRARRVVASVALQEAVVLVEAQRALGRRVVALAVQGRVDLVAELRLQVARVAPVRGDLLIGDRVEEDLKKMVFA